MIAVLGWGSLVWRPDALPVHRQWHADGPFVRVEFLRQSKDGRLTLVLSPNADPIRALWAVFAGTDANAAKEALADREGIGQKRRTEYVQSWSRSEQNPDCIQELEQWSRARGVEAVVWTALPPKWNGASTVGPSIEQAVSYLSGLTGPARDLAEEYVRCAPRQVDTAYRRRIEAALGWSYRQHPNAWI
jgi:hypothetical protein